MCSNTGTPNNHHFVFGTNGKVVVLGVPILKHFRVIEWLVSARSYHTQQSEQEARNQGQS